MKPILPVALLFFPLSLAAYAAPQGGDATLDVAGYVSELERWKEAASRLKEHPEDAAALKKQLPDHWSVEVQGQHFMVSTEWLGTELQSLEADRKLGAETAGNIQTRLDAMRQDVETLAQPVAASGVAREKLDSILKGKEFQGLRPPGPLQSLWDRLTAWLMDHLGNLFRGLSNHPVVASLLLWGLVIALGLVLLAWLVRALVSRSPIPAAAETVAGSVASLGTWQEWLRRARLAAGRGEYGDAVRFTYYAALYRLGELGVWQIDPSRTHREYLRLMPADSLRSPALAAITSRFERVWYGRRQASAEDFESAMAELEMLR